ncbi:MAG: alpha/beta hydrolase [Capsulimonadaceae bacterium]|nr:alpha/beta hydrolase [Capsulimonadaceae bacterium]
MIRYLHMAAVALAAFLAVPAFAQTPDNSSTITNPDGSTISVLKDVPYGTGGVDAQRLDLFVPQGRQRPLPLVVFIHGGGWAGGDKKDADGAAIAFARQGYAAASLNYRLAGKNARWPAQLDDCKAATRWLRSHSTLYGFDTKRFIAAGHSAGAHLAAMMGVTNGLKQFDVGDNITTSSDVQAVVWCAGISDMLSLSSTPGYEVWLTATNGAAVMLGDPPIAAPKLAAQASPVTYVSDHSVPFIIFHGDSDNLVAPAQAIEMFAALRARGVTADLHLIKGEGHGAPGFFSPEFFGLVNSFLAKSLSIPASALGNSYDKPNPAGQAFSTFDYPPAVIDRLLAGDPYDGNAAGLGDAGKVLLSGGETNASEVLVNGIKGYKMQQVPNLKPRYLYFDVDPKYKNGATANVTITLTYLDQGPDTFALVYDSNDPAVKGASGPGTWKRCGAVRIDGTGTWRKVQFTVTDALFNSRLNGHDLRVEWGQDIDGTVGPCYVRAAK